MSLSSSAQQLPVLPLSDTTLDNGLRVIIAPRYNSSVVNITVAYHVGAKDEETRNTGFAHLFEHLMFEGSTHVASGDFDRYCTMAGGHNNAYTTYDKTVYYMVLPSHQLEMGLWLESDRMLAFAIDENSLQVQQNVVSEEINQNVENRPYGRLYQTFASLGYAPGTPYSWEVYGSKEHIEQSSLQDVRAFYETWYRPDNACLVICGNVSVKHTMAMVEKYFGSIPRGNSTPRHIPASSVKQQGNRSTTLKDNVPMDAVFMAYHCGGFLQEEYFCAEVLASILSDGMSSRLYKKLVYDLQIASEIGAYVDEREHSSLFTIYAVASSDAVSNEALRGAIEEVVREFAAEGPETREILKARNRILTRIARSYQRNSGIAEELAHYAMFANDPGMAFRLPEFFDRVGAEALQTLALNMFVPERRIVVNVIPDETAK